MNAENNAANCVRPRNLKGPWVHGDRSGGKLSGLYQSWRGMKGRCLDPKNIGFKWYGARGIKIYEPWLSFGAFKSDLFDSWSPGMTLDRKNPNGDYVPDNVRWIPKSLQNSTRRNNLKLEIHGETKLLKDWAIIYNIDFYTIHGRLRRGWDTLSAVITPVLGTRDRLIRVPVSTEKTPSA